MATKVRVKCPDCQWTTLLNTLENARGELITHYFQFHGLAPVRQVEDSEDEVVQQPITNNWTDCKECSIWGTIQDIDSHCQQVHGLAPARHVEDSGDEVAKDMSSMEVFKPPVAHGWIECQECTFLASTQEVSDSKFKVQSPQDG